MPRPASRRATTRRPAGAITPAQRNRALEQMQRIVFDFMITIGATPKEIRSASAAALRNVKRRPYRMSEAQEFEIFRGAADLLAAWYSHAALLDDVGVPRPLPLSGPQSVESLITRYLPEHPPAQVIELLTAEGIIAALPNGGFRPLRRTALVPRLNGMTLDRMAVLLRGLLGTVAWNYRDRGSRHTRFERQVQTTHLPIEKIPEFDAMLEQAAGSLIDRVDNWLSQRHVPESTKGQTAHVGVSLFSYVENNERKGRARTVTKRRRRK